MTTSLLEPDYDTMRAAMVASQLRTSAVNDTAVVAAMAQVPRERFMPAAVAALAYRDGTLPLGAGREANTPVVTGRLLTEARLTRQDRVLLIGAAGGYTAAVLARIVDRVTAVESDPALAASTRDALAHEPRVTIVEGPLELGAADGAPYDVLIVDGAVERLPDTLIAQVREGGRIVTGLIDRGVTRLAAGARGAAGFGLVDFADLACVTLPGFALPRGFTF